MKFRKLLSYGTRNCNGIVFRLQYVTAYHNGTNLSLHVDFFNFVDQQ